MADDLARLFQAARADPLLVVLEGFHALKHALRFGAVIERAVTSDPELPRALAASLAPDIAPALARLLEPIGIERFVRLGAPPPSTGVLAIARRPFASIGDVLRGTAPAVLLDFPTHLGNIGAVIRVAAAAGARAVLTTGPSDPWHPAALRGSAGLHFALPVMRIDDLPSDIPPILALDPIGEPLGTAPFPEAAILVFGSERRGLGRSWRTRAVRTIAIPMEEGVSSLNLATSVAVTLYAWRLSKSPECRQVPCLAEQPRIS